MRLLDVGVARIASQILLQVGTGGEWCAYGLFSRDVLTFGAVGLRQVFLANALHIGQRDGTDTVAFHEQHAPVTDRDGL